METKTTVVNINTGAEFTVYIGRPSKWGNPFKIGPDGNRKEVMEKYKKYLLRNKELLADIMSELIIEKVTNEGFGVQRELYYRI